MNTPRRLPLETWGRAQLFNLQTWADRSHGGRLAFEFLMFGIKQAWACLFGGMMLGLLFGTRYFYPGNAPLARYDFLVLAAVMIQIIMLASKLESWNEAKVIVAFHIVGTVMELFKTRAGSWIYPEASLLRVGAVPLFSGFMYASVGSYLSRVWRIFHFRFTHYPRRWMTVALSVAIYVNFFSHHWLPDIRPLLFTTVTFLYWRCTIFYVPDRRSHHMPLLLGFVLVALFIWIAENIGTYSHAWIYPSQREGWHMVSLAKIGSWLLLMIISFVMVSLVRAPEAPGSSTAVDA